MPEDIAEEAKTEEKVEKEKDEDMPEDTEEEDKTAGKAEKEKREETSEAAEEEVKMPVDPGESVEKAETKKPAVSEKAKPTAPKKVAEACQMNESTDMSTVKIGRYLTVRSGGLWRILRVVSIMDERLKNMTGKDGRLETKTVTVTQQLNKVKEEMKNRESAVKNKERLQSIREKVLES